MTTIYLDLYIMKNFCMDYLLLHVIGSVLKLDKKIPRLLLASIIGAMGAAWLPLLKWRWSHLPEIAGIILWYEIGLLVLRVAYPITKAKQLQKTFMLLVTISFLLYGVIGWLEQYGIRVTSLQYVIAAVLVHLICGYEKRQWHDRMRIFTVTIQIGENIVKKKALLDTGNELKDPLSGLPVVIGVYREFADYLSEDYRQGFQLFFENSMPDYNKMVMEEWRDIRWIPYQTIGHTTERLMGIRCNQLWIDAKEKKVPCGKVILALVNQEFSKESEYTLILHKNMLH